MVAAVYLHGGLPAVVKVFGPSYSASVASIQQEETDAMLQKAEQQQQHLAQLQLELTNGGATSARVATAPPSGLAAVAVGSPATDEAAQKLEGDANKAWSKVVQNRESCEIIIQQVLLPSLEAKGLKFSEERRQFLMARLVDVLHATSSTSTEDERMRVGRLRLLGKAVGEMALQVSILTSSVDKKPLAEHAMTADGLLSGEVLLYGVEQCKDVLSEQGNVLSQNQKVKMFQQLQWLEHAGRAAGASADGGSGNSAAAALEAFLQEFEATETAFAKKLIGKLWEGVIGCLCWSPGELDREAYCLVLGSLMAL